MIITRLSLKFHFKKQINKLKTKTIYQAGAKLISNEMLMYFLNENKYTYNKQRSIFSCFEYL
jgi:hypothetical protein